MFCCNFGSHFGLAHSIIARNQALGHGMAQGQKARHPRARFLMLILGDLPAQEKRPATYTCTTHVPFGGTGDNPMPTHGSTACCESAAPACLIYLESAKIPFTLSMANTKTMVLVFGFSFPFGKGLGVIFATFDLQEHEHLQEQQQPTNIRV